MRSSEVLASTSGINIKSIPRNYKIPRINTSPTEPAPALPLEESNRIYEPVTPEVSQSPPAQDVASQDIVNINTEQVKEIASYIDDLYTKHIEHHRSICQDRGLDEQGLVTEGDVDINIVRLTPSRRQSIDKNNIDSEVTDEYSAELEVTPHFTTTFSPTRSPRGDPRALNDVIEISDDDETSAEFRKFISVRCTVKQEDTSQEVQPEEPTNNNNASNIITNSEEQIGYSTSYVTASSIENPTYEMDPPVLQRESAVTQPVYIKSIQPITGFPPNIQGTTDNEVDKQLLPQPTLYPLLVSKQRVSREQIRSYKYIRPNTESLTRYLGWLGRYILHHQVSLRVLELEEVDIPIHINVNISEPVKRERASELNKPSRERPDSPNH